MTVKIEITGTADEVRAELAKLLSTATVVLPAVSEVSSDTPKTQPDPALPAEKPTTRRRKSTDTPVVAENPKPLAISTGEERVNPEATDTAAQDAADEAEDTEKQRDPEKPLTIEDVKAEVAKYVAKWTYAAAKWDLQFVWREASGGKADRLTQLMDADQPTLKAVIEATRAATDAEKRRPDGIAAQAAAEAAAKTKAA